MRAVVQRCTSGSVSVGGETISCIQQGYVVLLAVAKGDTQADADYMIDKISAMRVFEDENEKMNLSLLDVGGAVLMVSQFTLYGDVRKGKRPSFSNSAGREEAIPLYEYVILGLREKGICVETGVFGEMMRVHITNDGPVTILLDSKKEF